MGPSSMLFGRGSTGGVINQVLKKPSLKKATELSVSVTTNGLVRSTADVNMPTGEHRGVPRQRHVPGRQASTRDQTDVLDFGIAPSYKFGIGTPTEVTLLRPAAAQPRPGPTTACRRCNGYPAQRRPQQRLRLQRRPHRPGRHLAAAPRSSTSSTRTSTLRNQTQFNYVNTDARETAPQTRRHAVADRRLHRRRRRRRHAVQRRAAQPALRPPAEPRPQHPRRHARQPDRADGEVRHRPAQHTPAGRRRARLRELLQPELLPHRHLQRRAAAVAVRDQRLRRLHAAGSRRVGNSPGNVAGRSPATWRRRRPTRSPATSTTRSQVMPAGSSSSAACATTSTDAQIGNSINIGQYAGQHDARLLPTQTVTFTSVRGGVDLPADAGAVLLRLLQHLVQSVARAARRRRPAPASRCRRRATRPSKPASSTTCSTATCR